MSVVLYSNHCPKCNVLAQKLKEAKIVYEEINDIDLMFSKGFSKMPTLEVDSNVMDFMEAFKWAESFKN